MIQKECPKCRESFKTKDSRQTTCSIECAKAYKTKKPVINSSSLRLRQLVAPAPLVSSTAELPDPDLLPAPYAKRVYEMWKTLIGETPLGVRIA